MSELFIGLMSGTSMDAIDAVLVDFQYEEPVLLASHAQKLPKNIRNELLLLCQSGPNEIERMGHLDMLLGKMFAQSVQFLLNKAGIQSSKVVAIGSHGQTIRHHPDGETPFSLQIGNPSMIAHHTGITTVADFRNADVVSGGQGAPLVPTFHNFVLRSKEINRVVVNIGGIANITILPSDQTASVTGFDTGPGNVLMDYWMTECFDSAYDRDGYTSKSGTVIQTLLTALLSDPYFKLTPPKSTGREHFNAEWLNNILTTFHDLKIKDETRNILTTLCEFTAVTISDAIRYYAPNTSEVLICGGGVHNKTLMTRLGQLLVGLLVKPTTTYGLHADWMEAIAFAWLARQTLNKRPGNLPSVTGAKNSAILGGIYYS